MSQLEKLRVTFKFFFQFGKLSKFQKLANFPNFWNFFLIEHFWNFPSSNIKRFPEFYNLKNYE